MAWRGFLHHHPGHRGRQLRWILPLMVCVLAAVFATLAIQYRVSDQAVTREFFRAHKTISHTGELLERGVLIGGGVLLALVVALAVWAFRVTHRIVRPVHTMHRALDALAAGDLGVRVELHRDDEFREVGDSLNRLVEEFSTTLATVHALVDRVAELSAARATGDQTAESRIHELITELDDTIEFFRLAPRRTISENDR
ncbi:MAG TPA: methyl-accepting chemotaxis protein [Candidatus Binatia bacterium]|nr:methyl-accepting chemotaxis protein [Candidatus Binatia bacterium]